MQAITENEQFLKDVSLQQFTTSKLLQLAVIKNIEIIGEAAKNISPEPKKRNQQIPWRDIIDTRNVFSHQYFGISTQIVWNVCKKDLPTLKKQMQDLLNY